MLKKKYIKEGLLSDKGKPNEKTPSEWFEKIGAKSINAEKAKELKEEIEQEVEDVSHEKKKKKKKKKEKESSDEEE